MNFDSQQLFPVLGWFLLLQFIALSAFPVCFGLFPRLPDRGYALAKFIGILLASYLCWILSSTGVFGFTPTTARLSITIVFILGMAFFAFNAPLILRQCRLNIKQIICTELIFWGGFALMFALRSQIPQITSVINDSAAEKFTDFAIFNSLLCSPSIPPQDAWVSTMPLNYYYFGHFIWAFLTKTIGVLPEVAFNLALCSVTGLIATLAFSLGTMIGGKLRWGWLAAFLIVIGGNLDSARLCLIWLTQTAHTVPFDFWQPSRAVANCITEFPAFSLILSDLHAHLLDFPAVLAALIIGLELLHTRGIYPSQRAMVLDRLSTLAVIALIFGATSASNSWDLPILVAYIALMFWCAEIEYTPLPDHNCSFFERINRLSVGVICLFLSMALALVGTVILFAPFRANFHPPFDGFPIQFNLPQNFTELSEFVAHWGIFILPVVLLLVIRAIDLLRKTKPGAAVGVIAAATLLTLSFTLTIGNSTEAISLCLALGAAACLLLLNMTAETTLLTAILLLIGTMTAFCEIFHVNDIFGDSLERINTIFKIYYALWPLAAMAALLALKQMQSLKRVILIVIMLGLAALYTPTAVTARLAMTSRPPQSAINAPLDGLSYLQENHRGDLDAIRFIRDNVPPTDIILECPGTQYTYAGRISTCTGRPTLGGWLTHAWEWRGEENFGTERERRTSETLTIYSSPDSKLTEELIKNNQIRWVVIGKLEREKIPYLNEDKFANLGKIEFRSDDTSVYLVFPNERYPYNN